MPANRQSWVESGNCQRGTHAAKRPMILMWILYAALGRALSIGVDWATFDGVALEVRGQALPDGFTYSTSSLGQKVAIVAAGVVGGLRNENEIVRVSMVFLWAALHLALYNEWYRAPK